jgi:hypothetical protein
LPFADPLVHQELAPSGSALRVLTINREEPIYDHERRTVSEVTGRARRTDTDDTRDDRVARHLPGHSTDRVPCWAERSLDAIDRSAALLEVAAQHLGPNARVDICRSDEAPARVNDAVEKATAATVRVIR